MTSSVSVLMAARNAAPTIRSAIASVCRQDYPSWELIIVDDGSVDNTAELVAAIPDGRIRLISLSESVGRAAARNRAVALARHPILAVADADDLSMPCRLRMTVEMFDAAPDVGVVGGQVLAFDEHGVRELWRQPTDSASIRAGLQRNIMTLGNPTVALRRSLFEAVGGYTEDWAIDGAEDLDLCARLASHCDFRASPEVWTLYRRPARDEWRYLWQREKARRAGERRRKDRSPGSLATSLRAAGAALATSARQRARPTQHVHDERYLTTWALTSLDAVRPG